MSNTNYWITLKNAAKVTGLNRRTIHRLISRDELDTSTEGRETIIILADLERSIAKTPSRGGDRRKPAIDNQSQVS